MTQIGLYGKLPAHGDFLVRHISPEFVNSWDHWLQRALASSQEQLGEHWLNIYLTSPIWRFVLAPGIVDNQAWAGIVMPSVDKVGRYFPLTLAQSMPTLHSLSELVVTGGDWFQQLEDAALLGLEDGVDVNRLERSLAEIAPFNPTGVAAIGNRLEWSRPIAINLSSMSQNPMTSFPFLVDSFLQQRLPSYSLWWTSGSGQVAPSFLVAGYLPAPQYFAAMLDGHWQHWNWNQPFGVIPPVGEKAGEDPDNRG